MNIIINTTIASYKHEVKSCKDLLDLVVKIVTTYKFNDNEWKD